MRRSGTAAASLVGMLAFLVSAAPAPALQDMRTTANATKRKGGSGPKV